jgi:DNA-binding MarR family transcriptional regulator
VGALARDRVAIRAVGAHYVYMHVIEPRAVPRCNCAAIREAARQVTQMYDSELAHAGLRSSQYTLLAKLTRRGPLSLQELADELVMARTTLTRNLAPLQRDGLVANAVDGTDRRARRLSVTAKGAKRFAVGRDAWQRAQDKFNKNYGEQDAAELRRLLSKVVDVALQIGTA